MEKPNMIVLWGRGNSGKTHTLNIVLLKLYKIYGACISYEVCLLKSVKTAV